MDSDKAKLFLSKVEEGQSISLHDHCVTLFSHILRCKIPDVYEKFEEISLEVKNMRQTPENYLTEVFEIPEELQAFVKEKEVFYKFKKSVPEVQVTADEEEEESDDEEDDDVVEAVSSEVVLEETDLSEVLPDIYGMMGRFQEAGIGLSPIEVFELTVALKDLAIQFKLKKVKFWGKLLGIKNDYYIAEAPYQEGIVQENFGWNDPRKIKKKSNETSEENVKEEDEDEDEDKVDEEDEEKVDEEAEEDEEDDEKVEEKEEETKIPPIPEPQQKLKKRIPAEKNGTGVNEYLYFACTKLGEPWRVLPFMLPLHITEARYLKRYFTGDLESEIGGCIPYPGKEAHYLRAQIARITATAWIAPNDFYKSAADKDEDEDEDDEDERDANEIVLNSKYQPKSVKCLLTEGIAGWCHYRKAILDQGRCIPMKIGEKDEDEDEEEGVDEPEPEPEADDEDDEEKKPTEDPEILEAIVETQVPVLRNLSEDKGVKGLSPWCMKLSCKLVEEKAVLLIYSNIWPEAYTYYDGKNFDHIYIGYGFKYTFSHYAPPIRVALQSEYVVGDDLIEHVDKEVFPEEEKEAEADAEGEEGDEKDEDEEEEDEED